MNTVLSSPVYVGGFPSFSLCVFDVFLFFFFLFSSFLFLLFPSVYSFPLIF